MDIGSRIKQLRKGKYTAKDLAEKIGVTREHLSAVENNTKPISLPTIEKICDELGYTLQEFFYLDLKPELKELLDIAEDLDAEQLESLKSFLKSIREVKKTLPNGNELNYIQEGRKLTEEEELAISEYLNKIRNDKK